MDWRIVERRLERAFAGTPTEVGQAHVVEREEPYRLGHLLIPADWPDEFHHGNVAERLDELGIDRIPLLSFLWNGFGPSSFQAGLDLVGSGPQRYMCWWDEDESCQAVAAIFPWWDRRAISRTIVRFLGCAGEDFGLQAFGALADETSNNEPDLVDNGAVRQGYRAVMDLWEAEYGNAWLSLARQHYARVVEPSHLQRCLDDLQLALDDRDRSPESLERAEADLRRENRAFTGETRTRLLDEWLGRTFRAWTPAPSGEAS